jgi:4-amino-4-deoxy-L-arabinose transferase-like glycosyltransferase
VAAVRVGDGRWGAVSLAILVGVLLSFRLNAPGWFDNEGRYAEMAREIVLRHDWVTPRVNDIPLLTKPPLTQWLAALVFLVTGPSEWARLVPIVAAMLTIVLTCRLGARLYGVRAGLVAGLMLATSIGFVFEARTLRPDCLVVLAVTAAVFCWSVAETGAPARRTAWLAAMYATLAFGMLAKGLVAPVIALVPIGIATVRAHGLAGVKRLRPGLGLLVVAAIVLPWHVAAAYANPGFAWDYVVNQHLLFAFDKKEPRDSEGDTLAFFWQSFVLRGWPWIALAPLTLREALRGGAGGDATRATAFLWTWIAGVLGVFSLTPSRLEHYSLPALPAVALLGARAWQLVHEHGFGRGLQLSTAALAVVLLGAGTFGLVRGRELASAAYWMPHAPGLMNLVVPAALATAFAGLLLALAAIGRSATGLVVAGAVGTAPFLAILVRALMEADALFSWRPAAHALERVPSGTEIVFEAPIEYQIVGALDFYLGHGVTMIEPPGGYTPPTYLEGRTEGMFISRDELDRRWRSGRPVAIVSDPQKRRDAPDGLTPAPFHVLDRFGDRWVLTNFPVASAH